MAARSVSWSDIVCLITKSVHTHTVVTDIKHSSDIRAERHQGADPCAAGRENGRPRGDDPGA